MHKLHAILCHFIYKRCEHPQGPRNQSPMGWLRDGCTFTYTQELSTKIITRALILQGKSLETTLRWVYLCLMFIILLSIWPHHSIIFPIVLSSITTFDLKEICWECWLRPVSQHFERPRQADHLRSGIWDQPGQHIVKHCLSYKK